MFNFPLQKFRKKNPDIVIKCESSSEYYNYFELGTSSSRKKLMKHLDYDSEDPKTFSFQFTSVF